MSEITDPNELKKIVSSLLIGKQILSVGLRGAWRWDDHISLDDVVMIEIEGGYFLHIEGNNQIDRTDVDFQVREHSTLSFVDPDDGPIVWVNS